MRRRIYTTRDPQVCIFQLSQNIRKSLTSQNQEKKILESHKNHKIRKVHEAAVDAFVYENCRLVDLILFLSSSLFFLTKEKHSITKTIFLYTRTAGGLIRYFFFPHYFFDKKIHFITKKLF